MAKNIMNCPNCKKNTHIVYKNKNMAYGSKLKDCYLNIKVNHCEICGFTFQSSAYTKQYDKNISKLYKGYTISNMYNFPNKNKEHLEALDFLKSSIKNNIDFNVLEIGSNRGDFLYLMKEKYPLINILGCEPTEFKKLKIPTINAFFDKNLFNTKFDLVILRHTLEHIKSPILFIQELDFILKKSSQVFIEVPNLKYSLKNYIEDFTPDHVNFFDKSSLIKTVNKVPIKTSDKKYLYILFKNKKPEKEFIYKKSTKFPKMFKLYNKNQENILKKIKSFDRIVFYGISNFYLWTYQKLQKHIKNKTLFFMDDFLKKDHLFNLNKLDKLEKNDLVILCSSNKNIQNTMYKKITKKNVYILFPWKEIIYVQN